LEDIGREMQRTGVLVQPIPNSSETYLDVPRLTREKVLFDSVAPTLPTIASPEELPFALGRTPDGRDIIKDLKDCPHLLVGGSTGSGKTVFLWTLLVSLLKSHPRKEDLQLVVSSSGLEDFIRFEGLPHLVGGKVYSDATETSETICDVVFKEFERRKGLLTQARVENIIRYNETHEEKLAPMVVVVDEFADLTDQLSNNKQRETFYKPIRQIAQIGRKRGIHLVLCTQRPSANLLPTDIKAQLGGRIALRVNEATSSRMILDEGGAQDLQKHGDMIYKNGSEIERAQGYLLSAQEVDEVVASIINANE
jgi:DNA segregation ATPase FtsK/SpoIIIE-like protein